MACQHTVLTLGFASAGLFQWMLHGAVPKKPVVIDAVQYHGQLITKLVTWIIGATIECKANQVIIPTLEGDMRCDLADWIIGVKGKLYPCKSDIFAATYLPANS